MIVTIIYSDHVEIENLPEKVQGQYWIGKGIKNPTAKRISVEAQNNTWVMKSNRQTSLVDKQAVPSASVVLEPSRFYRIKDFDSTEIQLVFVEETTAGRQSFAKYRILKDTDISIGRNEDCSITYSNRVVSGTHAHLQYRSGVWSVEDCQSTNGTFVNNVRVMQSVLSPGDVVYIMGLKIIVGLGVLAWNNPDGKVVVHDPELILLPKQREKQHDLPEIAPTTYFYRAPRFKREVVRRKITIDPPPTKVKIDTTPIALLIVPSMTMGMASVATAAITIINLQTNGSSLLTAIPTSLMAFSMLLGSVLWPILTKKRERKAARESEELRNTKYTQYLKMMDAEIQAEIALQKEILAENCIPALACVNRILKVDATLWNRASTQNDFLQLRIGQGTIPVNCEFAYPERKFSMEDDHLLQELYGLALRPKLIQNAPVTYSLREHPISGLIGERAQAVQVARGLIAQIMALYSYDEVKLCVLYDEEEKNIWDFAKWLPHCWSNEEDVRFVASDLNGCKQLSAYFETILASRREENASNKPSAIPHYVVFATNREQVAKIPFIRTVCEEGAACGFSIIYLCDAVRDLPKECSMVVELTNGDARLFNKNDITGQALEFTPDDTKQLQMKSLAQSLAKVKLDLGDQSYLLPAMLSFLQMFQVGRVEHLNALTRWKENNPSKTLQTPVGVDTTGDVAYLDLHEKVHGPHGLIAGMTGSGKSEFIITYILSLAINYHPDEVAFILIDYKGGGLTGAFESDQYVLPHLAGTVTNLDGGSIKRSLISIQSELRRRQAVFSEACRVSGEGTMDVYKYQQLRRAGVVKEAVPHLFIIADEFAELKAQQPEFMAQLISTARIGRSLGVHLILATQKPSGVVDDQIWSNARFHVCLKVQDRADSMDMIKRPDAAELSATGRYYLQVGFNELFELGQSAWSGAAYIPQNDAVQQQDNTIAVLDAQGHVVATSKLKNRNQTNNEQGKQIIAVNRYLHQLAQEDNIHALPLWLPPIPAIIVYDALVKKYHPKAESPWVLNALVGEYDDPFNQRQDGLYVPFSQDGNMLLYGAANTGKGVFVNAMLWALLHKHNPDTLRLYLLDFGSESLKSFVKAPQVGDVLLATDEEKMQNLFKMLRKELAERKKRFADFGGDFNMYHRSGQEAVPNIVVVINNYSAFFELYEALDEEVFYLSREGAKYGIYFLLTAATTNAIRYRLLQNFGQTFVLQLNDKADYTALLGNPEGTYPANCRGRGVFRDEKVYEFQTAQVCEKGQDTFQVITAYCAALANEWQGQPAPEVPVLPERVNETFLSRTPVLMNRLPVGVHQQSLVPIHVDMLAQMVLPVCAQSLSDTVSYMQGSATLLANRKACKVVVLDPMNLWLEADTTLYEYHTTDLETCIQEAFEELLRRNVDYKKNGVDPATFESRVYFFQSMQKVLDNLSVDGRDKLRVLIDKAEPAYGVAFVFAQDGMTGKAMAHEPWVKRAVHNGIWIGDGIADQYLLKLTRITTNYYQEIGSKFAYLVMRGKAALMKPVCFDAKEDRDRYEQQFS